MEKVTEHIINAGVNDREITLFEGQYHVEKGMAYNSYVILDEQIAVMDTVDKRAVSEWMENLEQALAGKAPSYLIVQHMEPDHSAGIAALMEKFPEMKLVGSAAALGMAGQFLEQNPAERWMSVKENDTLPLGSHTLRFLTAPMVHWPEVMVTYEESEKVVFSADGFGKFGTRDADEDWTCEARRYYINICGKYGAQVQSLLKKLAGLDVAAICPLHGPVLTDDLGYYIGKYQVWSSYEPEDTGVLIACASIHGNTLRAAEQMKELLERQGAGKVVLTDLTRDDPHEAVEDAFRYSALLLAASSYDAGVFPPMEQFLSRLKAKNYQKRKVALLENGSWAPSAARTMRALLDGCKELEIVEPVVTIRSKAKAADLPQMEALAQALVK